MTTGSKIVGGAAAVLAAGALAAGGVLLAPSGQQASSPSSSPVTTITAGELTGTDQIQPEPTNLPRVAVKGCVKRSVSVPVNGPGLLIVNAGTLARYFDGGGVTPKGVGVRYVSPPAGWRFLPTDWFAQGYKAGNEAGHVYTYRFITDGTCRDSVVVTVTP